jgi:hypothetical protein
MNTLPPNTRAELRMLRFLSNQTRKTLMGALRSLQQQPVYASEHTRDEVLDHIAHRCIPTEVAAEVGRQQEVQAREEFLREKRVGAQ